MYANYIPTSIESRKKEIEATRPSKKKKEEDIGSGIGD